MFLKIQKLFLLVLLSGACAEETQPPKDNVVTIYLGPKSGSRIIDLGEAGKTTDSDNPSVENLVEEKSLDDDPQLVLTTTIKSSPHSQSSADKPFEDTVSYMAYGKTLNFTGQNLTGGDVKKILYEQSNSTRRYLRRLLLGHNDIWTLPMYVFPIELEYGLEELWLNDNPYLSLYSSSTCFELSRLRKLRVLSLANTRLANIENLKNLPSLEVLDLSGNNLIYLPTKFETFTGLRELNLSKNRLRYLSQSPLNSFIKLEVLNLASNGMEKMWDDPFKSLYSLETLYLNNNSLSEPPVFYHYNGAYQPQLTVHMSGNPWLCTCPLQDTVAISRLNIIDRDAVTCIDGNNERPLSSFSQKGCSPVWDWIKARLKDLTDWFRHNSSDMPTVYRSLGWLLFGVTIGLLWHHLRRKKTPVQLYNILDDKMIKG